MVQEKSFLATMYPVSPTSIPVFNIYPSILAICLEVGAGCLELTSISILVVFFWKRSTVPDRRPSNTPKSIPMFVWAELSHLISGLGVRNRTYPGITELPSITPFAPSLVPKENNEYFSPISWFPVRPHPILIFRLLNTFKSLMNCSWDALHANATDGKFPYLLFSPNLVEPSRLKVAVNKYLSLKL